MIEINKNLKDVFLVAILAIVAIGFIGALSLKSWQDNNLLSLKIEQGLEECLVESNKDNESKVIWVKDCSKTLKMLSEFSK